MLKFAPANPDNPFQEAWRKTLERTNCLERSDTPAIRRVQRGIAGLIADISHLSGIPVKILSGAERRQEIVRWRQLGYYVGMKDLGKSASQVGSVFGRDSSTVSDGVRRFGPLMKAFPEWLHRYEKIARDLP